MPFLEIKCGLAIPHVAIIRYSTNRSKIAAKAGDISTESAVVAYCHMREDKEQVYKTRRALL